MWPNPQEPAGLVTFTEEILNGKLQFLYSVSYDKAKNMRLAVQRRAIYVTQKLQTEFCQVILEYT